MKGVILYLYRADMPSDDLMNHWAEHNAEIFEFTDPIRLKDVKELRSLDASTEYAVVFIKSEDYGKISEILKATDASGAEYFVTYVISESGVDEFMEDLLNDSIEELEEDSNWLSEKLSEAGKSNFIATTFPENLENHVNSLVSVMSAGESLESLDDVEESDAEEDSVEEESIEEEEESIEEEEESIEEEEEKEEKLAAKITKEAGKRMKKSEQPIKDKDNSEEGLNNLDDDTNKLQIEVINFAKAMYELLQLVRK